MDKVLIASKQTVTITAPIFKSFPYQMTFKSYSKLVNDKIYSATECSKFMNVICQKLCNSYFATAKMVITRELLRPF